MVGSPFGNHSGSDTLLLLTMWPACGSFLDLQTLRPPPGPSESESASEQGPKGGWGAVPVHFGVWKHTVLPLRRGVYRAAHWYRPWGHPFLFHLYHYQHAKFGWPLSRARLPPAPWVPRASRIEATREPGGPSSAPAQSCSPPAARGCFAAPAVWVRHGVIAKPRLQAVGCRWALPVETDGVSGAG